MLLPPGGARCIPPRPCVLIYCLFGDFAWRFREGRKKRLKLRLSVCILDFRDCEMVVGKCSAKMRFREFGGE